MWGGGGVSLHNVQTERDRARERGMERKRKRLAYRPLQLQHRRFPRLVLKDTPGLGSVLPGVYLLIRGLPLVPVEKVAVSEGMCRGGEWKGGGAAGWKRANPY